MQQLRVIRRLANKASLTLMKKIKKLKQKTQDEGKNWVSNKV